MITGDIADMTNLILNDSIMSIFECAFGGVLAE